MKGLQRSGYPLSWRQSLLIQEVFKISSDDQPEISSNIVMFLFLLFLLRSLKIYSELSPDKISEIYRKMKYRQSYITLYES